MLLHLPSSIRLLVSAHLVFLTLPRLEEVRAVLCVLLVHCELTSVFFFSLYVGAIMMQGTYVKASSYLQSCLFSNSRAALTIENGGSTSSLIGGADILIFHTTPLYISNTTFYGFYMVASSSNVASAFNAGGPCLCAPPSLLHFEFTQSVYLYLGGSIIASGSSVTITASQFINGTLEIATVGAFVPTPLWFRGGAISSVNDGSLVISGSLFSQLKSIIREHGVLCFGGGLMFHLSLFIFVR